MVDYAHEPASMESLLQTLATYKKQGHFDKVIHIVSCDGVGRDDWKKPVMGDLSQKYVDFSIVTTENYGKDDNPNEILQLLSQNFVGSNFVLEIDRKEAMQIALDIAQSDPKNKYLLVSTGVGCEFGLTRPTGIIQWDERQIWRELFESMAKSS